MNLKKRGLGRGLDALLGDISAHERVEIGAESLPDELPANNRPLQNLPIEYLQRGKYQPRKDMNPEKLQELAESIKAQGVIQPIVARKIAEDKYEIVAGERRWRAAQLAGLYNLPVIVREIDDRAAMAIALIENIQREELNPLEEAEALKRLIEEFDMTHQQIADAVGRSRAMVSNLLRLMDLHGEVKELLAERHLEMGHARALLALPLAQQLIAAKKIVKEGLSVRATEQLVRNNRFEPKVPVIKAVDNDILRLQEDLTSKLGAKVSINHNNKNNSGRLVIAYSSLDELDGILEKVR